MNDLDVLVERHWICNTTVVESKIEIDASTSVVCLRHSEYTHQTH